MAEFYKKILENNRKWVEEKLNINPEYFTEHSAGQEPPLLWIGCSDSRVPPNEIVGLELGQVFVHRNIANMALHSDMNMMSVFDYAVHVLKVKHIIVCGHYGCGGVKAGMGNASIGIINNWINHIKDVYRFHKKELAAIEDEAERFDRFVELNVVEQASNLAKSPIAQTAWKEGQPLSIHGWVYNVHSGYVKDLGLKFESADDLDDVYQLKIK